MTLRLNCQKLLLKNEKQEMAISRKMVFLERGRIIIRINDIEMKSYTIRKIVDCINYSHKKYSFAKLPIVFLFPHLKLTDKLTYTIFECICKSLIEDYGHSITIKGTFDRNILTNGFSSSPILLLGTKNRNKMSQSSQFIEKFNSEIYRYHYRKVLPYDESKKKRLSQIYDDVYNFQKGFGIDYECIDEISEVVMELVGNAVEHTQSCCLLDIDIAPNYVNVKTQDHCCGVNITVLNISDILFGDSVREKITTNQEEVKSNERYSKIVDAYNYHKVFFSETYTATDFYNITSFQDRISGRPENYTTGGTGLTLLIKSIEERADAHSCYVISGDRKISLVPEFLGYDDDQWLGFNKSNDYLTQIPAQEILSRNSFFFPGTAYNLTFIMRENTDEKRK